MQSATPDDARNSRHGLTDPVVERRQLIRPVSGKARIDVRHDAIVLLESKRLILQPIQGRREQPGGRQQHKRERRLEHDRAPFAAASPCGSSSDRSRAALPSDRPASPSTRARCRRRAPSRATRRTRTAAPARRATRRWARRRRQGPKGTRPAESRASPPNAIARPAAPPAIASSRLSIRGSRTTRDSRAPSAMVRDVWRRRSRPRTSINVATLAQTISSVHPVTTIRISSQCWYCSRMLVMPAPPGRRNRVCVGNLRAIVGTHLVPVRSQPARRARAACALRRTRAMRPAGCGQSAPASGCRGA